MSKKDLLQQHAEQGDVLLPTSSLRLDIDENGFPVEFRERLVGMFGQVDKEFETLYQENALLREKVELLAERIDALEGAMPSLLPGSSAPFLSNVDGAQTTSTSRDIQHSIQQQHLAASDGVHDLRSGQLSLGSGRKAVGATNTTTPITKRFMKAGASMRSKLQQHPAFSRSANAESRSKTSNGNVVSCQLLHTYMGHFDGLWEVHACSTRVGLLGTASSDRTAGLFDVNSGAMLQQYCGHTGSVNSVRFAESPQTGDLWALTSSGDQTAHLWCVAAKPLSMLNNNNFVSSAASVADELDGIVPTTATILAGSSSVDFPQQLSFAGDETDAVRDTNTNCYSGSKFNSRNFPAGLTITTRDALRKFRSHSSVVSCADFLGGATDFIVTASWDRTCGVHDVNTGEQINCLTGHEDELTHVSSHKQLRLFATSSRDSTLRLWDFRDPVHSVSVFQGHTDVVTSTVFTPASEGNIVVSGSDDRTVKTWDLRNMRSAISVARFKSGVNRLSVSRNQVGVPLDNGQIYILDLNSGKLVRLPLLSKFKSSSSSSSHQQQQQHHHQHTHRHQTTASNIQQQQQHGSSHNNAERIVTSVAWLDIPLNNNNNNNNNRNSSSSRPRSARTVQLNASTPAVQYLSSNAGDTMGANNDIDATAAAAAAVQAASAVTTLTPPVVAGGGSTAHARLLPPNIAASSSSSTDKSATQQQHLPPPPPPLPQSSTTNNNSSMTVMAECNFFSSSFERGVAYGWRLENLYGF